MSDTEWIDEHLELYAIDALPAEETARMQRELDGLSPMERSIFDGRIVETQSAIAGLASRYAVAAPGALRAEVLDRVFGGPAATGTTGTAADGAHEAPGTGTGTTGRDRGDGRTVSPAPTDTGAVSPDADTGTGTPDTDAEVTSLDDVRRRRSARFRMLGGAAAAAVVVAVALAAGVLVGRTTAPEPAAPPPAAAPNAQIVDVLSAPDARVATARLANNRGTLSVIASRSSNQAVALVRNTRDPLPADRTFQLWLVGKAPTPVSAGLVSSANAQDPVLVDALDASEGIAITIEPRGGSAQPTTDILGSVTL